MSTLDTIEIKPSSVKLRRLSKTAIKLWTTATASTESRAPLNITQTFTPIKFRKAASASVSNKTIKQTRFKQSLHKTSSSKLPFVWSRTISKSTRCTTASPKPSSRITRAQKIRSEMKSTILKISVHGLKTYKHRYIFKCVVNPCNRQFATVRDWNRHISYCTSSI